MILRLILGDQLNSKHSWFQEVNDDTVYFMAEMRQETDYVVHHIQKITAFFCAMRQFAEELKQKGHQIIYYPLESKENTHSLTDNLKQVISQKKITNFEYQFPDEYRLDQQLLDFCNKIQKELDITTNGISTEHFMTNREDLKEFFKGKKQFTMEYFYRYMRKRYNIMMLDDKNPEGGKWNFDHNNRNQWKGEHLIPSKKDFTKNLLDIVVSLERSQVKTVGSIDAKNFTWATNRKECLEALDYFCEFLLVNFGTYQDAMHTNEWYLFHSNLSFAMNSKILSPLEVVEKVIAHWRKNKESIDISQVEGFVRQIIGWREYMRGMYWMHMPDYKNLNALENTNPLPDFYWTGKTKMNCLKHSIQQSLQSGYAHHIQRLMITGNYALLTQTHPNEVDQWYLGIYTDAVEWVQLTNTRGMSQFADGGMVATKPYVSSGSYINKMSNYCKGCTYKVTKKATEDACPFNALYWNFLEEKRPLLKDNQRMKMMYSLLNKMDKELLSAYQKRANDIINNPNEY